MWVEQGCRGRGCWSYRVGMNLRDVALLPLRLSVAASRATLGVGQLASPQGPLLRPGGYNERLRVVLAEGGLADQLGRILDDERGPIALANTIADLTAPDRPLGKALARGGLLDRMADEKGPFFRLLTTGGPLDRQLGEGGALFRFLEPDGPLDRLLAEAGPLHRLLETGGPLDRLLADDGAVERLLVEGGLVDQMVAENGIVETLLAPGGTLDQLLALGATFDALAPRLQELSDAIPELNDAVATLSGAVEPLGALAGRLPGGRRRGAAALESGSVDRTGQ